MSLAAYVAEDGLVGHHWEERPLGFAIFLLDIFFIYISNAFLKVPYTLPPAQLPYLTTPTSWPWRSPVVGHIEFAKPRGLSSQ